MSISPRQGAIGLAAVVALATPVVMLFEGTVLRGYRDPIGVVTACTGHTTTARLGRTYTHAECAALLREDFSEHWDGLSECLPSGLPEHVQAAVLSWAFNVGVRAACASTLMRRLHAGDLPGACAELSRWTMAGGKVLPGLVKRRAAERALCEGRA